MRTALWARPEVVEVPVGAIDVPSFARMPAPSTASQLRSELRKTTDCDHDESL
jgi:hypothetical protein